MYSTRIGPAMQLPCRASPEHKVTVEDLLTLGFAAVSLAVVLLVVRAFRSGFAEADVNAEKLRLSVPGPFGLTAFEGMPFRAMDAAWSAAPLKEWMGREFANLYRGTVDG